MERVFTVKLPGGVPSPNLQAALAGPVPAEIIDKWVVAATAHRATGSYIDMLTADQAIRYPYVGDPFSVGVVNTSQHAEILENGRAGFHLPSRWTKWKYGKNGNRYARVRFGHNTPIKGKAGGSTTLRARREMPQAVYKQFNSKLQGRQRLAGFGDTYKQSKSYLYYRQVFADFPKELETSRGYTWKASKYEGLTRQHSKTPGGGHHTEFFTVRTITPDSEGWYIPPMPGFHFADQAMQAAAPRIQEILDQAAALDLAAAMGKAMEIL